MNRIVRRVAQCLAGAAFGLATALAHAAVPASNASTPENGAHASASASASDSSGPHVCRIEGLRTGVLCGVLARALDPAQPDGPRIGIHYIVVPAIARQARPDPVFLLAGGPGQSAIDVAAQVMPLFARLNNRRAIVFVDQRGTGRSAPLECGADNAAGPLADRAGMKQQIAQAMACRERLVRLPYIRDPGDLRFFGTTLAMQDLDAVRQALGADQVDLVGMSYGTRAALEFMRLFPGHVRRAVLDGVAPPDMVLPQSAAHDARAALQGVFTACEVEPACRQAHPNLADDWQRLVDSLPREVSIADALTGRPSRITLTRDKLFAFVRQPLYSPLLASAIPQAIAAALDGRFDALAGLGSLFAERRGKGVAQGMHFSVVCTEDYPLMKPSAPSDEPAFGRDFTQLYADVCARWPRGDVSASFYRIPPATSPVLLVSGGIDPVTPPRHGERVAHLLGPLARHLVVPHAGHGVLLSVPCLRDTLYRFIDDADAADALAVDARCASAVPRPPAWQPLLPDSTEDGS